MKDIIVYAILLIIAFALTEDASFASTCRSSAIKHKFDKEQGYPHGRTGYVVDHVCALAQGGLDSTINMQYQTIPDSKAKDRVENTLYGKALFCTPQNSTPYRSVFNCK